MTLSQLLSRRAGDSDAPEVALSIKELREELVRDFGEMLTRQTGVLLPALIDESPGTCPA
ncbi:hypothetical protein [Streptomyces sp. NPDC059063]|uniref:hypothetical protein n=1 Tax=unclassified Streptomyces TaxID=2593676 RepID=UPI0036B68684